MRCGSCPQKLQQRSESVSKHYEIGPTMVGSNIKRLSKDTEGIRSLSREPPPKARNVMVSHTLASALPNRDLISSGKLHFCGRGFPVTRSYPTSEAASTSRGLAFGPFWTPACSELSRKSWLPTVTDSLESVRVSSNTSSNDADQFSQSLKIVRATDARKNSPTTSWRCSPTSPPNTTDAERTVSVKVRLLPDNDQAEAFRFFYGADRFMWNSCKEVADKCSQEAMEARVCELCHDHDDGVCHHRGCNDNVVEPDASYFKKKRWYCEDHVQNAKFGAAPRVMGRCRPYEAAIEKANGVCISDGCYNPLMAGKLRCEDHRDDVDGDPKPATTSSPYQFEAIKTIVCPPSSELLADRKWLDRVPCNTKTSAVKKFTSAASATFTKWGKGDLKARLPGFRSRKDRHQEFSVRSSAIQFKKRKPGCPPKARKRSKREPATSRRSALGPGRRKKSGARNERPRGLRSRPWSLRIFPNLQGSDKMDLRSEKDIASADRAKAAMRRPVRVLRKDMVRLKRFNRDGQWRDSKIMRDECGRHYLVLVMKVPAKEKSPIWENQAYADCFLDPGGRTFQTMYSPDGVAAKIGDDFYGLMLGKLRRSDSITAAAERRKKTDGTDRRYRRMLARAQALRTKVRNCVRDLHRKTARFLCINFKAIFIPRFESGRISRSTELSRRISSGSVRGLMTFAHAEFFQKLKPYAIARGVHVIEVGESYTTKTCTFCGYQNNVGNKKVIKCASCGRKADRDFAGSRNIAFRTAVATS